jgi:DNA-directed RNA polymerase specialized sigma subunit
MDERRKRRRASNPQDEALARSILLELPEADRRAIDLFYNERRSAADIERDLGLRTGYVNQLKTSVRSRFFAERGSTV